MRRTKRIAQRRLVLGMAALALIAQKTGAATFTVTNFNDAGPGSLRDAINQANSVGNGDITFQSAGTISLQSPLPIIGFFGSISGATSTISGSSLYRPFFVDIGVSALTISNLSITNGMARGGNGGGGSYGGGGGLGAGGALFVNSGHVTLSNVTFAGNSAVGGNGGGSTGGINGGGGGGGLRGNGGTGQFFGSGGGGGYSGNGGNGATGIINSSSVGSGGGGGGIVFNGGNASVGAGGGGGGPIAAGGAASGNIGGAGGGTVNSGGKGGDNTFGTGNSNGIDGANGVGGGGGGYGQAGFFSGGHGGNGGHFAGGGGGAYYGGNGGGGGDFGGGGGASPNNVISGAGGAGGGGFGGGGGGGLAVAGFGGFGGGGGGSSFPTPGGAYGGQGGGDSGTVGGGGGAALGGVIFVRGDIGAFLTISDSTVDNGTVTAGAPGTTVFEARGQPTAGAALGQSMFLVGGNTTISVSTGTKTMTGSIGDASSAGEPGGIIKIGSGTLILSGANTYGGGTFINGGYVTADSNVGAGPVALNGGGLVAPASATYPVSFSVAPGTIDTQAFNPTFSGAITGTGALTKIGTGTLVLSSASNAYSGGTFVTAGFVTTDSNTGTGAVTLNGGGLLATSSGTTAKNVSLVAGTIDTQSFNSTFSGTLSGAGPLIKAGSGNLVITGSHTATGGATISAGTLQVGAGGTTGSITGNVLNNTLVTFNRSDNTTFSGVISGAGSLVKAGASTLSISSTQSYTGPTTISAGTLQLTGGVPAGYAAYYSFDSVAGSIVTNGGSLGSSTNATIGGSGAVVAGGIHGNALSFPSTTAVLTPNTPVPVPSQASTVSAWFNGLYSPSLLRTLFSSSNGDSSALLQNAAGYALGNFSNSIAHPLGVDITADATGWHQLTVVEDVNTFNQVFYLDGQQIGVISNSFISSPFNAIGNIAAGGAPFAHKVDDVYIYNNVALTPAQVLQLYQGSPSAGALSSSTAIVMPNSGATFDLNGINQAVGSLSGVAGTNVLLGGGNFTAGSDNSSTTFSGVISSSGSFTKAGTGTFVLDGANTYPGGTTVSAGTLQIGNGAAAGAIVGNVVDNATLTFNRSGTNTYASAISGTGGVIVQAGTLALSGTNTNAAGFTVSAGTLQIGTGGAAGSVSGGIVDASQVVFNRSGTSTYAGVISGAGAVTKNATGTLILTGTQTYAGATTIAAGVLQLGNNGTTGTIAGNVRDNASLVWNRSDSLTYNGVISGTGSLTQAGTGTLALSNANTYAGATTIMAGVLQLGTGGTTGSVLNNITDNGTLILNRSDSYTFGGTISGSGALTQAGAGTVTMANVRIPTVAVSAGTLRVAANGGNAGVSVINSLTISSGKFDLNDNDLVVNYGVIAPVAAIRANLIAGYNNGAWNGNGLASLAANADATHLTALGYADAAEVGITSFDGQTLNKAVLVKYTYYGDSSLDGKVDLGNDFNLFLSGFLGGGSGWDQGDYNYDNLVNMADFTIFIDGYAGQGGSLGAMELIIAGSDELSSAQKAQLLDIVPEPSVMGITAIALFGALGRRRRNFGNRLS